MTTITRASKEWANRPNDQRFTSLELLRDSVLARKEESWTAIPKVADLRAVIREEDSSLAIQVYDPTHGETRQLTPTHWGFTQLAQYANCPAHYLRRLPTELAAINLQYGLERDSLRTESLVLAQSNGDNVLRAMTSASYGRIWDSQVVNSVIHMNRSGLWQIPAASYTAKNPKRATTLYASDRDVFIFLVDPTHPIEVGGETLFRGFITWNSEVGAATFGLCTFLYRTVCDNRLIFGVTDVKELRIRHNGGAPERFAYEGANYLNKYANESTVKTVAAIKAAQEFEIPDAAKKDSVADWLRARGFTDAVAKASVAQAESEEGEARTLWQIIQGVTAHARSIPHTNDRVALETQAGKLMRYAG